MILVTGHRGFIGRNMLSTLDGAVGYEWGDGDLSLEGVTRVIHLGAVSSTTCRDLKLLQKKNIDFSIGLLNSCAARKIPVQFASSASVYGPWATSFRETDEIDPRTPYAVSKARVEQFILAKEWPMPVQIFRYFNVYGPHEEQKDQPSPFCRFKRQALMTGVIEVFEGSETVLRDFVPVSSVVDTHLQFFDLPVSGVYNLGTGKVRSFRDVAEEVSAETGAKVVEIPMPRLPGYQRYTRADMTKTNQALSARSTP